MIVNETLNNILDVYWRNQTQTAQWYMGLIDNASFSALAAADTMSSHAGWIENDDYAEATRPSWTPAAAASGSAANSTSVDFSINATPTIYGFFLTSNNTKNGTTGKLGGTAAFSGGPKGPLDASTILKVTCTATMAAA